MNFHASMDGHPDAIASSERPAWEKQIGVVADDYAPPDGVDLEGHSAATPIASASPGSVTVARFRLDGDIDPDQWTPDDERCFQNLSRAEALGHISRDDLEHLESMQRHRSIAKRLRSPQDVLFDHERFKLLTQIERALDAYGIFVRTSR